MRRIFWLGLGLGAGAAAAIVAARWTRRQAQRMAPSTLAREARSSLLDLSKLVAESLEEGKRAMREAEERARAGTQSRGGPPVD
jgi:hypothetical protein